MSTVLFQAGQKGLKRKGLFPPWIPVDVVEGFGNVGDRKVENRIGGHLVLGGGRPVVEGSGSAGVDDLEHQGVQARLEFEGDLVLVGCDAPIHSALEDQPPVVVDLEAVVAAEGEFERSATYRCR